MDKTTALVTTYVAMTFVVVFGFVKLKNGLRNAADGQKGTLNGTAYSWTIKRALSENIDPGESPDDPTLKPSFSRLCGAIGMIIMAGILLGVGMYGIWSLFENGNAAGVKDMGAVFLSGSALFAPYAFNQIKATFQA